MEATSLTPQGPSPTALLGRSPLLRLQSDEKLVALVRRGHPGAFDALVQRYQARLRSFCRQMLRSAEDAEDVLQEVFVSAYNAILADTRSITLRPWLYRLARNRSLNHLRRPQHARQDAIEILEGAGGDTTADAVHRHEDFRLLLADVRALPETQRTALLMRARDGLTYEQIAEAMETTVPSVRSLLVRARVGLAEAAEARMMECGDVRLRLAAAAEGIEPLTDPVRRHVKSCERCRVFRGELRRTTRALAAIFPGGALAYLQKLLWGKFGFGGSGGGAASGAGGSGPVVGTTVAGETAGGASAAASGSALGGGLLGGGGAGGLVSTGIGAIATKAAVGLAAAAIVTAGGEAREQAAGAQASTAAEVQRQPPPADGAPHALGQPTAGDEAAVSGRRDVPSGEGSKASAVMGYPGEPTAASGPEPVTTSSPSESAPTGLLTSPPERDAGLSGTGLVPSGDESSDDESSGDDDGVTPDGGDGGEGASSTSPAEGGGAPAAPAPGDPPRS